MIQVDRVAFYQKVIKETASGAPNIDHRKNHARQMRHRTAAHIGEEDVEEVMERTRKRGDEKKKESEEKKRVRGCRAKQSSAPKWSGPDKGLNEVKNPCASFVHKPTFLFQTHQLQKNVLIITVYT